MVRLRVRRSWLTSLVAPKSWTKSGRMKNTSRRKIKRKLLEFVSDLLRWTNLREKRCNNLCTRISSTLFNSAPWIHFIRQWYSRDRLASLTSTFRLRGLPSQLTRPMSTASSILIHSLMPYPQPSTFLSSEWQSRWPEKISIKSKWQSLASTTKKWIWSKGRRPRARYSFRDRMQRNCQQVDIDGTLRKRISNLMLILHTRPSSASKNNYQGWRIWPCTTNSCHLMTDGLSANCQRTCTQSQTEWYVVTNLKRHWERLSIRLRTGSNPSQLWTPSRVSEKIQTDKLRPSLILKSLQRKSRLSLSSWSNSGISTRIRARKIASAPGTSLQSTSMPTQAAVMMIT